MDKPVTFTSNRLALIVPRSNPADIRSVYDLKRKPVKLVVAGAAVPVGGYTRTVLRKMGLSSVLSKVVSQETDVRAVTGKVALGQADAGFVYITDAKAVADRVIGDPHPGVGTATRALRDRRRLEARRRRRPRRRGSRRCSRRRARPLSRSTDSCRFPERVAGDALFRTTLVLATSVVLLFLLLPIVAVFLQVPPRRSGVGARHGRGARRAPRDGGDDLDLDAR